MTRMPRTPAHGHGDAGPGPACQWVAAAVMQVSHGPSHGHRPLRTKNHSLSESESLTVTVTDSDGPGSHRALPSSNLTGSARLTE